MSVPVIEWLDSVEITPRTTSNMRKTLRKAKGAFLDAASCGSSVRYECTVSLGVREADEKRKIRAKRTAALSFEVALADCARVVIWNAYEAPLARRKLRVAIALLQEALREVHRADQVMRQYKRLPLP